MLRSWPGIFFSRLPVVSLASDAAASTARLAAMWWLRVSAFYLSRCSGSGWSQAYCTWVHWLGSTKLIHSCHISKFFMIIWLEWILISVFGRVGSGGVSVTRCLPNHIPCGSSRVRGWRGVRGQRMLSSGDSRAGGVCRSIRGGSSRGVHRGWRQSHRPTL